MQDKWGRQIFHIDQTGKRVCRVLVHLKAANRDKNHKLFVKLRGDESLKICKDALKKANRNMVPRIPSATVLESFRPNYAKYFKESQVGECSTCKPA